MVRFYATRSGEWLDLAKDAEFELEIDSPVFESEFFPTGVSTSISFPPSEVNCRVFGYLRALLLPPSVNKLEAILFYDGIPLYKGTLTYDQVDEQGNLQYMFAQKSSTSSYDQKIWSLSWLPRDSSNPDSLVQRILAGEVTGVGAPLLYDPGAGDGLKFHNLPDEYYHAPYSGFRFSPCVSFPKLFAGIRGLVVSQSLSDDWNNLWMLGLHKPFTGEMKGYGDSLSIGDCLPDLTLADTLRIFARLTCSMAFASRDGGVSLIPFQSILGNSPVMLDGKVSETGVSFSVEPSRGYLFGYEEEESVSAQSGIARSVDTYKRVIDLVDEDDYSSAHHIVKGDTFSVPPKTYVDGRTYAAACDILDSGDSSYELHLDDCEDWDGKIPAHLAQAVPVRLTMNPLSSPSFRYKMATRVSFPKDGADRDGNAIIGCFRDGQMVGLGTVLSEEGADVSTGVTSFAAKDWSPRHLAFRQWLVKPRQVIRADIALSLQDILDLRMDVPVMLRHRKFLIRRLSLRMAGSRDGILSSIELVSL